MKVNEIAAYIHADMCNDSANGYSWSPRWGEDGKGVKTLTVDGRKYQYDRGSFDCSSSVITAWREALKYTEYAGRLDKATYTGNMRAVFKASGLFDVWPTATTIAQTGDVYLNDQHHTAMCQSATPDLLSEFCINEHGEVYNGKTGDQTSRESYIHAFYEYPWDVTLHYNGKADAKSKSSKVLYGIDVSSNQPADIVKKVANDFAIVKLTGNPQGYQWNYVNPSAAQQAKEAVAKHGLVGFYHFAYGKQAEVEADFFVEQVKKLGYLGKSMLVIDYEDAAVSKGQTWLNKLAKRVESMAGYKPVIYASGSVVVNQNLMSLGYPIWCANYPLGYQVVKGYNPTGKPYVDKALMWQFTSKGRLTGYSGDLDLDVFYGSAADFKKLMKPQDAASLGCVDGKYEAKANVAVRSGRSIKGELLGKVPKGTTVKLTTHKLNSAGNVWAQVSSGKFKGGYVCVRKKDGTWRFTKV